MCHAGPVLDDGTYDVFVVDAAPGEVAGAWDLELTIVAGEHKGEVVSIVASGLKGSEIDLMGMPGTLTVTDGQPTFAVDA